jgi:hypothetical protein
MKQLSLILFFLLACSVSSIAGGQTKDVIGEGEAVLRGMIVDWQDARISNASIIIEAKNFRREVAANESGEFKVELPIGTYRVSVSHPVFKTKVIKKLKVPGSELPVLKVTLKVKTATEGGGKCPKGHVCL